MPTNRMPRPFLGLYLTALGQGALAAAPPRTGADRVILKVPRFRQERSLSCEMAALRMAAHYHKSSVSENDLVRLLPVDPAQPRMEGSRVVWCDADRVFAGNIRGWQLYYGGLRSYPRRSRQKGWGYGVHGPGIAEVATRIGLQAEVFDAVGAVYLALERGQVPVVIVPCRGRARSRRWQWFTPAGLSVNVIDSEHAIAVTGYDEWRVWVNDPLGQVSSYERSSFETAFGLLRSGVAIAAPRIVAPVPAPRATSARRPRLRRR